MSTAHEVEAVTRWSAVDRLVPANRISPSETETTLAGEALDPHPLVHESWGAVAAAASSAGSVRATRFDGRPTAFLEASAGRS